MTDPRTDTHEVARAAAMIAHEWPTHKATLLDHLDLVAGCATALATTESHPDFFWPGQALDWESVCGVLANELAALPPGTRFSRSVCEHLVDLAVRGELG